MLCGHVDPFILVAPGLYNVSHCFTHHNLTLPECQRVFGKMFDDLLCMQRVKSEHLKQEDNESFMCHCPPPCKSKFLYEPYIYGPTHEPRIKTLLLLIMPYEIN